MSFLDLLVTPAFAANAAAPAMPPLAMSDSQIFLLRMASVVAVIAVFYLFMVVPQQKRMKKYKTMVDAMQPGDRVVTSGGLVGTLVSIEKGNDEVAIDLGGGVNVTALRSMIQARPVKMAETTKA